MTAVPGTSIGSRLQQPVSGIATGSDAGLMFRLRNDDAAALDELMIRYWAPLVNYVANMLGDRDAAHDIAQEAFVRLWQRRQQWDPRGSAGVWLFRTGRNLVISEQRRRQVRARWVANCVTTETPSHTSTGEAENEELRVAVEAALRQLSPRRREAFTLFYIRDFSYRDIADIMGIRPQSVANYLQAALGELRAVLAPFCSDSANRQA